MAFEIPFLGLRWSGSHFNNSIAKAARSKKNSPWNFVFIDEFSGSGKSLKRRIDWFKSETAGSQHKIYLCFIAAMEAARSSFSSCSDEYFCTEWLTRGISDYYSGQQLTDAISDMNRLETTLAPKIRNRKLPSFGYSKTEALYSMEIGNTPNNVFPVFWWEMDDQNTKRNTVLRRLD